MSQSSSARLPRANLNDLAGDTGVLALRALLSRAALPSFEVPRERDYGIDVLAFVTTHSYDSVDGLEDETNWVQREAAGIRAAWNGDVPSRVEVPARLIGFQVKTSQAFSVEQPVWTVRVAEKSLEHWRSAGFPMVVVASDVHGNLRYLDVESVDDSADTKNLRLTRTLGIDQARSLHRAALSRWARVLGLERSLDLLDPDPDRQLAAVHACWALIGQQQPMSLLTRCLPSLHQQARREAAMLLSTVMDRLRDLLANDADGYDADGSAWVDVCRDAGLDGFDQWTDLAWRSVAVLWQSHQVITINQQMVPVGAGEQAGWYAVPDDPWPGETGEVADLAKQIYNRVRVALPWDAVTTVLALAPSPVALVTRLAVDDLADPTDDIECDSPNRATWWGSLLAKVALDVEREAGRSVDAERGVRRAVLEFLDQIPALRGDPTFMQFVAAWDDV